MERPDTQQDSDRLGALVCRFRPQTSGWAILATGGFVALLALMACTKAGGVFRRWASTADDLKPYLFLGWLGLACAALLVLGGFLMMGRAFEIRRWGVRYRSWWRRCEMLWPDINEVFVNKVTFVQKKGIGKFSSWNIRISSTNRRIELPASFLNGPSALVAIKLLKKHRGEAIQGSATDLEEPFPTEAVWDVKAGARKRKKNKARPMDHEASDPNQDVYREACRRLECGESVLEVEEWLLATGVPADAATALVDKAMAEKIRRQVERPTHDEWVMDGDNPLIIAARAQRNAGIPFEKIESWLRAEGLSKGMAAAIIENLREELL